MTKLWYRGHAPQSKKRGSALFAVVPLAILVMSLMVAFVGTSVETSRATVEHEGSFRARAAAQNAASMTISELWGSFDSVTTGGAQMWALRQHLETMGLTDQSGAQTPQRTAMAGQMSMPRSEDGRTMVDGVEIERLDVHRIDQWDSTQLVVEIDAVVRHGADGNSKEHRASVQEIFNIAPPVWDGLDYAMLANNINCLLCHTTIDNAERFYNQTNALAGTFEGVKVGSLESMHFREDPDSRIAGRALIGGDALYGDGENVDWSRINLMGALMDEGLLIEDGFGNLDYEKLAAFNPGSPDEAANLFLDFHAYADQTDQTLPTSFPSPFPDNGGLDPTTSTPMPENAGNRVIDDSEFFATVAGSAGRISGGDISVLATGDKITKNTQLNDLLGGTDSSISGVTEGNVYMHGTEDNPIVLDGDVAIDGDLILSGYVVGEGAIRARGNVYIPSDLVYLDGGRSTGERTFGMADDGRANNLALAAGGNVVVGDPYRAAWSVGKPTDGEKTGSFNFIMDELAIFNRQEWIKTQPTLPGKSEKYQTGTRVYYKDERVKETYKKTVNTYKWVKTGNKIKKPRYKWITVTTGNGPYATTSRKKVQDGWRWIDEKVKVKTGTKQVNKTRWVKTGNKIRIEEPTYGWRQPPVENPYYVPDHIPRYYSFTEGSTIPIFNKDGYFDVATQHWKSDERPAAWDDKKLSYADVDNKNDPLLYNADGSPKAVVSAITPTNDWMTREFFNKIINRNQAMKQSGSKTLEIDATVYSANSILGVMARRGSGNLDGKLLVNGGIVAADVGLLAPNGTQINYDGRGARALSITADNGLVVSRHLSAPLPRAMADATGAAWYGHGSKH